jgi:Protein of unknown function (DUF2568)
VRGANLVVRFLLELSALAATAYWGFSTASGFSQWVLGLGAPALVAVVWGLFVSPKAKVELARSAQFAVELLVFAAAALALVAADQPVLGIVLGGLELVSGTLNYVWNN